jgi:hypothetical protein
MADATKARLTVPTLVPEVRATFGLFPFESSRNSLKMFWSAPTATLKLRCLWNRNDQNRFPVA